MCAIVDNDVAGEVFGDTDSPAGREFFNWLNGPRGRLVVGGKLLEELEGSGTFRRWARNAALYGRLTTLNGNDVDERTREIESEAKHSSNDAHVIAVAQIGGARLLFTNDQRLEQDFLSKSLIDNPRGRIFHTRDLRSPNDNKDVTRAHRHLLSSNVCRS